MRVPFDDPRAADINKRIFAAIYYGAVTESVQMSKEVGPYSTFQGSPASQGKLQFDLWGVQPIGDWPWEDLKRSVVKHGMRNSLLVAPMPTASTSQILNNTEVCQPLVCCSFVGGCTVQLSPFSPACLKT